MRLLRILFFLLASCQLRESGDDTIANENINSKTLLVDTSYKEGERLFKDNCSACHNIHDKVIGPALKEMDSMDRQWLYKWIKDSQALIKTGDEKANKIYKEYRMMPQPSFNLSEQEIDNIVNYVSSQKKMRY